MAHDRWQKFFEQAEKELGEDAPLADLSLLADDLLANDEASRVDRAWDMGRDPWYHPPTPPKPVDWR